ncbi:MAG: hypothetical protein P8Z37_14965, partial [Acidobacteriota bacterium]
FAWRSFDNGTSPPMGYAQSGEVSPLQPAFLTRVRSEEVQRTVDTRRATENPADILDSMSRSLKESATQ